MPVENIDTKTIIIVIKEWIKPSTAMISYSWKAYDASEKEDF